MGGGAATAPHGSSYGRGIYLSPHIEVAEEYSTPLFCGTWANYKVALFVRVRPGSFEMVNNGLYWVVSEESDVRVVDVLFKEVSSNREVSSGTTVTSSTTVT